MSAFRISEDDRNQILYEHDETNFQRSGEKTKQFTIIDVTVFKGRTREAKRKMYARIIQNLNMNPGVVPFDVLITINDPELVNWGVADRKCTFKQAKDADRPEPKLQNGSDMGSKFSWPRKCPDFRYGVESREGI